jgi:hypothetical protein
VIHNNRIHHTEIQFSFGFGLYLDDASDEYTVTRNLLHDLGASEDGRLRSAIYVKGVENVFRDNVIADCDVDGGVFGSMKLAGLPNRGLVIHQNVVADCNDSRLHLFRNWDDDRIAYENYNLFHHPDDEYHVDGVPWGRMVTPEGRLDVETLDDWRRTFDRRVPSEYETRYDGDSVTERPRFLDPDLGDYRLRYDSPARDLDIRGVDVAGIGLREGFAYADPDDPLAGVYVWDPRRPGRAHCSLSPGESTDLTVTVRTQWGFVADVDVRYESEDPDVATVEGGEVSAHEAGVATLTATAEDDSEVVTGRFHVVVE